MLKKNLLIVLDQGLGDAIASIGVIDLLAKNMSNYNIIIIGKKNSVQVFQDRKYIHDSYIIPSSKNAFQRISNFIRTIQFINKHNIDECIRMIGMRRSVFYAFFVFFVRFLNVKYPYYISILLLFSKCKNIRKPVGWSHKFHYKRERHYQNLLEYCASCFPEYFQNVDFNDKTFCIPRIPHGKHIFQKPTIGIHPGTSKGRVEYPVEFYADVAFRLAVKHGFNIAIFSGNSWEIQFGSEILERLTNLGFDSSNITMAKPSSYQDFCDHTSSLSLLICNDSGPMHVASALNVPVCVYPSPGMLEVLQPWYPCIDDNRYAVFSAQDLQISNIKKYKTMYKRFRLLNTKILNVEEVVNDIVKTVEAKHLL